MTKPKEPKKELHFGIAAVADRTGLSMPLIRIWEKRYGCLKAKRTKTNRRVYDAEDITRLILLKKLTALGHAISGIAKLNITALTNRLQMAESLIPALLDQGAGSTKTILTIGPRHLKGLGEYAIHESTIVGAYTDLTSAIATKQLPKAELLVVDSQTLDLNTVEELSQVVRASRAKRTILIHHLKTSAEVLPLVSSLKHLTLLKAPVTDNLLRRECVVLLNQLNPLPVPVPPGGNRPIPDRLYQDEQLLKVAQFASAVDCECPHHIADLLKSLTEFEKYSADCADKSPQDAQLHHFLHRTTAHVRRLMEEALRYLVKVEGIAF